MAATPKLFLSKRSLQQYLQQPQTVFGLSPSEDDFCGLETKQVEEKCQDQSYFKEKITGIEATIPDNCPCFKSQ
jgi:hypothetical protein